MSDEAQFGPYEPEELIATGAHSSVWVARAVSGEEVALKIARDGRARTALLRERKALELVGDHPGLPTLRAAAPDGSWLALERIIGDPIDVWAADRTLVEILDVMQQVVEALGHLHGKGVLHNDLKGSNVLVDLAGKPHLLDLGVATLPREDVKGFRGTLGYAAPELLKGDPPSRGGDIYGLGALLYRCVTGRPPFVAADPAALTYLPLVSLPAPPASIDISLPGKLCHIIQSMLARNPRRRPSSLEQIAAVLGDCHTGRPPAPILGMDEVREELRQAVVGASDGESRVVVVYGPPGSGRRTLIAEAVEHARREGLTYHKGGDPRAALASLQQASRPPVIVMRATSGSYKLAQRILQDGLQCLLLVHADRALTSLRQRGAILLTPTPLNEQDALRLAAHLGIDPMLAGRWWRESLGLPIALIGRMRAHRRLEHGRRFNPERLPPESRRIYEALLGREAVPVPELAGQLGMGEHAVLDHCEVLFAERVIEPCDEGRALKTCEESPT